MAGNQSLYEYFKNYLDKRLLTIFVFGVASGFPWVMIGSAMSAWLKEEGLSRSTIGLFGLIFAPYAINFLWSPLVDRIKLPFLYRLLGQRRSWIFLMQVLLTVGCLLMTQIDVGKYLEVAAYAAILIAFSSATQDIAIDAYRIDIVGPGDQQKIAAAAGMATSGWWTGYAFLGSIAFFVADLDGWTWSDVYVILALIMASFSLVVLFLAKEPQINREQAQSALEQKYIDALDHHSAKASALAKTLAWISVTVIEPFREFFTRNTAKVAVSLLLFIFFFKIGEAFLGKMSIVFYKEVGFSNTDIGYYSKLLGGGVTIVFTLLGSLFTMRFGIVRGLFLGGLAMAASNLMFSAIAYVGPNKMLFVATILVDGYTTAWSTVAFVSFISMLCNTTFSATQYALLASLSNLNRTLIGSSSGMMVDYLGGNWALFFLITALMVIPGLLILYIIRKELHTVEAQHMKSQQVKAQEDG